MTEKGNKTKSKERRNFPLRLSDEMRKSLKILSAETDTSMNDLIIRAIEQVYPSKRKNGKGA